MSRNYSFNLFSFLCYSVFFLLSTFCIQFKKSLLNCVKRMFPNVFFWFHSLPLAFMSIIHLTLISYVRVRPLWTVNWSSIAFGIPQSPTALQVYFCHKAVQGIWCSAKQTMFRSVSGSIAFHESLSMIGCELQFSYSSGLCWSILDFWIYIQSH